MQAIVTGVEHYVPEKKLTNFDLEKMVDTNDEWIVTRTGIKERGILDADKASSYMGVKAAQKLLLKKNISPDEIDLIIVATATPDMLVPATAALIQKKLNATNCWGYDLNASCSGFLFGLVTASQFIASGMHKKVLLIGVDKMSAIIDYEDRNTCVIFGDGAGAVLLEPSQEEGLGFKDSILHIDGTGEQYLNVLAGGSLRPASHETVDKRMHYLYQDGKAVYKRAVTDLADVSEQIIARNNLTNKDIKLFIPHQANYRIIDAAARRMGLDKDKVVINIAKHGNTTDATIPIAMSECYSEGRMKKGDWIILASFGAGYTWGSVLLKWAID